MKRKLMCGVFVQTIELICPYCGETIPAKNGSLFWTVSEIENKIVICPNCKSEPLVPKKYR